MPDNEEPKAPAAPAKGKSAKKPGARPDLASLIGIALALGGILGGLILEKGQIGDVAQGTAALIVLGGTIGAVLITTPMAIVQKAFRGIGGVFFEQPGGAAEIIQTLIEYAGKAR